MSVGTLKKTLPQLLFISSVPHHWGLLGVYMISKEYTLDERIGELDDEASVVDLEPAGCPRRRRSNIINLSHVDNGGTVVIAADSFVRARAVTGLLVHLDGDGVASFDGTSAGSRSAAVDVTGQVLSHSLSLSDAEKETKGHTLVETD
jgi:hypothetical protein